MTGASRQVGALTRRVGAVLLAALLLAAGPVAAPIDAYAEPDRIKRLLDLINDERVRHGLAALVSHPLLVRAAQAHAEDMAAHDFFGHRGSDGASFSERFLRTGYDYSFAAENLSAGLPSPEDTIRAWMASEPHRLNILDADAQDVGIGFVYRADDGGKARYHYYWTLEIGRRMSHSEAGAR